MKSAPLWIAVAILAPAAGILPLVAQSTPSPSVHFLAQDDTNWLPPDTHGAAGPNHLVTAVNGGVRIQDRSGNVIRSTALNTFLNRTDSVFDPKVFYDHFANRWLLAACANAASANSAVIVAASQTADPNGAWWVYSFDADASNNVWADYPSVGFNKNWFAVGMNMFPIGSGTSSGRIYVLSRTALYSGGSVNANLFNDSSFTLTPAVTHDATLETLYVLQSWNGNSSGNGYLRLSKITGSVNAPQFSVVGHPSSSQTWRNNSAPSGNILPQSGGPLINGGDDRMQTVVYRNGSIWAAHNGYAVSGSTWRSFVQWWQINPQAQTLQHGRIEDSGGTYHYCFPSLGVNANNDVLVGFSRCSAGTYASAAYAFRGSGDAANTMRAPLVYKAGEASYQKNDNSGRNRWGDYSATMADPVDDTSFWTIQEYAATGNDWATRWARVEPEGSTSTIRFAQADYAVDEAVGNATITVNRSGNLRSTVTVNYATSNGSANSGSDYSTSSGTLSFGDGESAKTFTVPITDDSTPNEGDETVNLTLSSPGTGANLGSPSTATLTIADNDTALPVVTVAASDNSASEPSDPGVFTFTRSGSTAVALTVSYGMSGSATNGTDYQSLGGSVTIPGGSTTTTVTLTPIDDAAAEGTESATLTLNTAAAYTIGSPSSAAIDLLDNDQTPVVTIQATDPSAAEAGDSGRFTITRSGTISAALTVNLTPGGSASAGNDYTSLPGSANIPAGATTATIDVNPLDDSLVEGSETVVLSIASGTGYLVGSPLSATVTIADNDAAVGNDAFAGRLPFAGLNVNGNNTGATKETGEPDHAGNAGGRSVWWTWTASFNGSVTFSTDGSSFDTVLGVYTGSAVNALTTIASDDDSGSGQASSVTFTAVSGTVYQIAVDGYSGAAGSIVLSRTADPVALATVTIAATDADATEGSSDDGVFTVTRTGSPAATLALSLNIGGSASNGVDYSSVSTGFTLPAGASSGTLTIAPLDDANVEGDETVIVTLLSGSGYLVGSPSAATVTIADNDSTVGNDLFGNAAVMTALLELGTNAGATKEAGEPNHAGNTGGASVWWRWTATFSGTVSFDTNGSSFDTVLAVYTGTAIGALSLVASDDDGGDDTASLVTFTAVEGTTYQLAVDGFGGDTGTITLNRSGDPAPKPLVSVSASDATAKEGSGDNGSFRITRTGATTTNLSVNVSYEGTAINGSDYATLTSPQIIPVGASSLEIAVTPVDDALAEGDETATIVLEPGADYDVEGDAYPYVPGGRATATVTITDNDVGTTNDAFADRFLLTGSGFSTTGGNASFTEESGEPDHAANEGGKSAWWQWTAASSGSFTITTAGSTFDTLLAVYTGGSVSTLAAIASNDDSGSGLTSEVTFSATAGTAYQIAVDGYKAGKGSAAGGLITLTGAAGGGTLLPPVLTGPTSAAGSVGVQFGYVISATNSPTSFGASGLPAGLAVDTLSGTISGTPTTAGESQVTISATNAAGTGNATLTITVLDGGGLVLYQTDFESFAAGAGTITGNDGWLGDFDAHGTYDAFPGRGQAMYVGFDTSFLEGIAFFWHPLDYEPLSSGTPLVRLTAEIGIIDSTNDNYDDFVFEVYNRDGEYLASILFENSTTAIYVDDGGSEFYTDTGQTFTNDVYAQLEVEIDYASNTWTASLHGTELFAPRTFHAGDSALTLGDVTLVWSIIDPDFPGDNLLAIDNFSITAESGATTTFTNGANITIPDSGTATPYPSTIGVSDLTGVLDRVTVTLEGLTHSYPSDLDILLVAPDGRGIVLMSDSSGSNPYSGQFITFDDLAPTGLLAADTATHTGRYRPTDFAPVASFPPPAPTASYLPDLSSLHGIDPNGQWQLFIQDVSSGDSGSLAGWSLELGSAVTSDDYLTWRARYFSAAEIAAGIGDENEDPENDGMDNLLEYALGLDPTIVDNDSPAVPRGTVETHGGTPCLCLHYTVDLSRSGITIAVETSTNLLNWSPFTGADVLVDQTGTVQSRVARLPIVNPTGMLRLAVTRP